MKDFVNSYLIEEKKGAICETTKSLAEEIGKVDRELIAKGEKQKQSYVALNELVNKDANQKAAGQIGFIH